MPKSRGRFIALEVLVARRNLHAGEQAIKAGRVVVDGRVIMNPNARVRVDASVRVQPESRLRGDIKLSHALDHFAVRIAGRVAADVGASAGGFTTAVLDRGAARCVRGRRWRRPTGRATPRRRTRGEPRGSQPRLYQPRAPRRMVACGRDVRVRSHWRAGHDRVLRPRSTRGGVVTTRRHPNQGPLSSLPPELRRTSVPASVREWVRRELGSEVLRWRRLPGASTSAVHRLFLADGCSAVLRRYVWRWVLEDEPEVPRREVDALRFAARNDLPVPEVLASDVDGASVGDGIPALVMSFVPGRALSVPDPGALATVAAGIHAIDATAFAYGYFPWYRDALTDAPPDATDQRLWRRAIEIWHTQMPEHRVGLVHRDFHPGNVLWKRGAAHVVDWANACAGPSGCDIAHCRDNLIHLAGFDAADLLLRRYQEVTGADYDPYWEIASVLEHSPSSFDAARVAMSEARLRTAVAQYA